MTETRFKSKGNKEFNQPSQGLLELLNGQERQYLALAGAGSSIEGIAHTMGVDSDTVLSFRASTAGKILKAYPAKIRI